MLKFKDFLLSELYFGKPYREQNPVEVDAYHGSGKRFSNFDQKHSRVKNDYMGGGVGYFTTNKDISKSYAKNMAKTAKTDTPYIYHTKLKMKNVFDVDHDFHGDKLKHILPAEKHHEEFARHSGLLHPGVDKYDVLAKLKHGHINLKGHQVFRGLSGGNVKSEKAREHLVRKGYDGLRYNGGDNMDTGSHHHVYIPYNSDSIHIHKVTKIVKKPE
jgi:hypothetical protein